MNRPYVRVYHDALMTDYPEVYGNDGALATWLRLLVIADKMWPAPAELPRWARAKALAILTESGLVQLMPPHCFRIKGYDTERTARQDAARNAAAVRWQSGRNAEPMPSPRPSPSPSPKDPPNPPRGARSRTNGRTTVDRKAKPESIGAILRRAAEMGHGAA